MSATRHCLLFAWLTCVMSHSVRPAVRAEAATPGREKAKEARTDTFGDPLPPGARARLWTIQRERPPEFDHDNSEVNAVAFSPDGKTLASACTVVRFDELKSRRATRTLHLWELTTSKKVLRFQRHLSLDGAYAVGPVAFSPDGKLLAVGDKHGLRIELWNPATGKSVLQANVPFGRGRCALYGHVIAFSPKATSIYTVNDLTIHAWNVGTSKETGQFGHQGKWAVAFAPNGGLAAAALGGGEIGEIRLFDVTTGKTILQLHGCQACVFGMVFSPDGKTLASWDDRTMFIWDLVKGKLRCSLSHSSGVYSPAFSPDGKTLAKAIEKTVCLWEVATGKRRGQIVGHQGDVTCTAFSPDGRTLASGSQDMSAIIWHLPEVVQGRLVQPVPRTRQDLERLWADLAGEDAGKAYQANWALVLAPKETIPYLKEHLQPPVLPDNKRLTKLIADLDDEEFRVRQEATQELDKLGELAEPSLRKALATRPSLEVRQRLLQLLNRLAGPVTNPEKMRSVRAVELVEQIGTPEAKKLLETLAQGAAEARLTQEAAAAVDRLAKRLATPAR